MSVNTAADTHLDEAKRYIQNAIKEFSEIVINKCDGHDGYTKEYQIKIKFSLSKLLDIRDTLE